MVMKMAQPVFRSESKRISHPDIETPLKIMPGSRICHFVVGAAATRHRDLLTCFSSSRVYIVLASLYVIHSLAASVTYNIYHKEMAAFFVGYTFCLNCAVAVISIVFHRRVAPQLDAFHDVLCSGNFLTKSNVRSARRKRYVLYFVILMNICISYFLLIWFVSKTGIESYFIRYFYGLDIRRVNINRHVAEMIAFVETIVWSVLLLANYLFQMKYIALCDLISLRTEHLNKRIVDSALEEPDIQEFTDELSFLWTRVVELDECMCPIVLVWCVCITLSIVTNVESCVLMKHLTAIDMQSFWLVFYDAVFLLALCLSAGRAPEAARRLTFALPRLIRQGDQQLSQHIQVIAADFSLSAWRFLYVDRGLIISVFGVVLTYIIVLIQVGDDKPKPQIPCPNVTVTNT